MKNERDSPLKPLPTPVYYCPRCKHQLTSVRRYDSGERTGICTNCKGEWMFENFQYGV